MSLNMLKKIICINNYVLKKYKVFNFKNKDLYIIKIIYLYGKLWNKENHKNIIQRLSK